LHRIAAKPSLESCIHCSPARRFWRCTVLPEATLPARRASIAESPLRSSARRAPKLQVFRDTNPFLKAHAAVAAGPGAPKTFRDRIKQKIGGEIEKGREMDKKKRNPEGLR